MGSSLTIHRHPKDTSSFQSGRIPARESGNERGMLCLGALFFFEGIDRFLGRVFDH